VASFCRSRAASELEPYFKDGKPAYAYNYVGLKTTKIAEAKSLHEVIVQLK
jgi:hypothetical protein